MPDCNAGDCLPERTFGSRWWLASPERCRKGQFSIRINDQYRVCFPCEKGYPIDVTYEYGENGRLKVSVEYLPEREGRPRTLACEGDPAEIDAALRALPERERNLARVALERIRALNPSKPADGRVTPGS